MDNDQKQSLGSFCQTANQVLYLHCLTEYSLPPDCIIDNHYTDKETEAQRSELAGLGSQEVNNEFWTTV